MITAPNHVEKWSTDVLFGFQTLALAGVKREHECKYCGSKFHLPITLEYCEYNEGSRIECGSCGAVEFVRRKR